MKKIFFICFLCFAFSYNSNGQLSEGDMIIDVNHALVGGKGVWSVIPDAEFTGPIALRFQYMNSEKFGVGFEANFSQRNISGNGSYNDTVNQVVNSYNYTYEYSQTVVRFMIRTSWEFVNNDKFNMSWSNSIGYRSASNSFDATDDNGDVSDLEWDFGGSWPLAGRTALGLRYFITDNIGLNTEVGLSGGAYINFGASVKL